MKREKFETLAKAGEDPKGTEKKGKPPEQFEIDVVNEFDEDEVGLHVVHVSCIPSITPGKKSKKSKPFEEGSQQHYLKPREPQTPHNGKNKRRYFLAPFDYIIITLYKDDDNRLKAKNWYVELPSQADFEFISKDEQEVVPIPITGITRKTRPKGKRVDKIKDEKTKIIMERGQSEWELVIWSPALEEYQPDMEPKSLANENGTPDNVKIGDNGP
jgi:hypothetical protein